MDKPIYQENNDVCYQLRTLNIDVLNDLSKANIDVLEKNIDVFKHQRFLLSTSSSSHRRLPLHRVSGVTYPIVAHWIWSPDGWLSQIGYSDFSGAGAVHLLAGTCSFVAALFIGPRIGRFSTVAPTEYNGHSMPVYSAPRHYISSLSAPTYTCV